MISLNLIIGPMYAGKTTHLINKYKRSISKNLKCVIIKHSSDDRYNQDKICTHDQTQLDCYKFKYISEIIKLLKSDTEFNKNEILFIDESQFFHDLHLVTDIVEKYNKTVYVYGLNCDFKRQLFGKIHELIPFCDTITKLHGKCQFCQNDSLFSHRITQSSNQVLIGSVSDYVPLCRSCYNKNNK